MKLSGLERPAAVTAFDVALAMPIWWAIARYELGTGIGLVGAGISFAGLLVAIAVFVNQGRTAAAQHDEGITAVGEQRAQQGARDEKEANGEDQYVAESALLETRGIPSRDGVRRFARRDIPLKLIRDLVNGWERSGQSGNWTVEQVCSARRRSGKGNHAWWLVTRDPDTQSDRVFKVARGGRGMKDVTVTEIAD